MHDDGSGRAAATSRCRKSKVRQEGDNSIQEYSRNGRVYMVVVTPKNGITQTYMVDPQGRLVDEHGQKPVGPVMYKVLEWGKSQAAGGGIERGGAGRRRPLSHALNTGVAACADDAVAMSDGEQRDATA